jgi:hypothetical protein
VPLQKANESLLETMKVWERTKRRKTRSSLGMLQEREATTFEEDKEKDEANKTKTFLACFSPLSFPSFFHCPRPTTRKRNKRNPSTAQEAKKKGEGFT